MKNIKYFLLFVTALCASRWQSWEREPQRGLGPRTQNHQRNGFDSRFQKNGPMQQYQNTYLQPQENQLNLNAQLEQAPEAEFQFFGSINFNEEQLQLPEQQLQALFKFERFAQKLNNGEQLTEQQIFSLFSLMFELQPIFQELQEQQIIPQLPKLSEVQIQADQP